MAQERLEEDRTKIRKHWDRISERIPDYISMDIIEYEDTVRAMMRADEWEQAKFYLEAADLEWGYTAPFLFLNGRYYYHIGDIGEARRYWLMTVKEDKSYTEALEWLLRLETEQKNYSTAIVHINELLEYSPYNIRLWRKKIELYRLLNNDKEADKMLERLAVIYPENEQIKKDLIYRKELQLTEARKKGDEQAVQQQLHELITAQPGKNATYYLDLASSLIKQGRLQEAEEVCAMGVLQTHGNRALVRKRVALLTDQALYQEAERYLDECIRLYHATDLQPLRDELRGEYAQYTAADEAYARYAQWYGKTQSDEALDWLIRTAMQRGYWDDAQYYLREARRTQGDNAETLAKAYVVEQRLGNSRAAARLLEQRYAVSPDDEEVRELLAEKRLHEATDLMSDEQYRQAIPLLEQADTLTADEELGSVIGRRLTACRAAIPDTTKNDSIEDLDWMTRSVRYEKAHALDSAYACLMRYVPSPNEYHYVQRHRYELASRLAKNTLSFEYQYARRSSVDQWSHNAYLTYSHSFGNDVLEASAAYAGRESSAWTETTDEGNDTTVTSAGGSGVQIGLGYSHYFRWGDINIQGSWASRFLPQGAAKIALTENLPHEWALTERLSWRYINDESRYHLWSAGLTAAWTYGQFYLAPSIDAFLVEKHVYFNGGLKFQYFPLDGDRSHVFTSVGVGNAPEVTLLDNNLPIRFAHLNTNVSAGGYYTVNEHLGLAGSLSWYVIGSNNNTVRNYLYLNVSMNIRF